MRLSVHQPLAFNAFDGGKGAVNVAIAERYAMIIAVVKFGEITVKMLLSIVRGIVPHPLASFRENMTRAVDRRYFSMTGNASTESNALVPLRHRGQTNSACRNKRFAGGRPARATKPQVAAAPNAFAQAAHQNGTKQQNNSC